MKAIRKKISRFRSSVTGALIAFLENIVPEARIVSELSYPEVIKYFVNCRPDDRRVAKGSVLRRSNKFGTLTIWTFLDDDNNVLMDDNGNPYGKKLIVKRFDAELEEAFGISNVLIIN